MADLRSEGSDFTDVEVKRGAGGFPQSVVTVVVPNHSLLGVSDLSWVSTLPGAHTLSDTQKHALVAMRGGVEWTNSTLRDAFPMDSSDARALLLDLVTRGLAEARGENKWRTYVLAGRQHHEDVDSPTSQVPAADSASGPSGSGMDDSEDDGRAPVRRTRRDANAARIVATLDDGGKTVTEIMTDLDLTRRQVEYALGLLRTREQVRQVGGRGVRQTRYERS